MGTEDDRRLSTPTPRRRMNDPSITQPTPAFSPQAEIPQARPYMEDMGGDDRRLSMPTPRRRMSEQAPQPFSPADIQPVQAYEDTRDYDRMVSMPSPRRKVDGMQQTPRSYSPDIQPVQAYEDTRDYDRMISMPSPRRKVDGMQQTPQQVSPIGIPQVSPVQDLTDTDRRLSEPSLRRATVPASYDSYPERPTPREQIEPVDMDDDRRLSTPAPRGRQSDKTAMQSSMSGLDGMQVIRMAPEEENLPSPEPVSEEKPSFFKRIFKK